MRKMLRGFRGVAEGHYRANNEEGQRILDGISTSLDRAHQEQQQASAQFQQANLSKSGQYFGRTSGDH